MLTTRWQPLSGVLSEVNRWQQEMDRLVDRWGANWQGRLGRSGYPALNLWDDANALHVEVELPGLALEDLEIYVENDRQLTIKGQRKPPQLPNATWHRQERGYGEFSRSMDLPEMVDADKVTAEFKRGVLTITLPKREEVKPRRIMIQGE